MMYAIYDETGRIVRSIECPPDKIEKQVKYGEQYVKTDAHDGTHYIKKGEPVLYPEKPSDDHQFDFCLEQWVDTKTDQIRAQEAIDDMRQRRNMLLAMSDWTQMPDSPLSDEQKSAWRQYRQALRDMPQTNGDWPNEPG